MRIRQAIIGFSAYQIPFLHPWTIPLIFFQNAYRHSLEFFIFWKFLEFSLIISAMSNHLFYALSFFFWWNCFGIPQNSNKDDPTKKADVKIQKFWHSCRYLIARNLKTEARRRRKKKKKILFIRYQERLGFSGISPHQFWHPWFRRRDYGVFSMFQ